MGEMADYYLESEGYEHDIFATDRFDNKRKYNISARYKYRYKSLYQQHIDWSWDKLREFAKQYITDNNIECQKS